MSTEQAWRREADADAEARNSGKTPSHPTDVEVWPGAKVYSYDDEMLGTVADVEGELFQVAAERQKDFWLSKATIRASQQIRVDLAFDSQQIAAYRMSEPADASAADPFEDVAIKAYPDARTQAEAHDEMVEGYGHIDKDESPKDESPLPRN